MYISVPRKIWRGSSQGRGLSCSITTIFIPFLSASSASTASTPTILIFAGIFPGGARENPRAWRTTPDAVQQSSEAETLQESGRFCQRHCRDTFEVIMYIEAWRWECAKTYLAAPGTVCTQMTVPPRALEPRAARDPEKIRRSFTRHEQHVSPTDVRRCRSNTQDVDRTLRAPAKFSKSVRRSVSGRRLAAGSAAVI